MELARIAHTNRSLEGEEAALPSAPPSAGALWRYQEQGKPIPGWVRTGMDEHFRRVEKVEQWVQMLVGIFASHGVLPLEFKPAYSVGDLLPPHLDALEQEAAEKGGLQRVLADHFA